MFGLFPLSSRWYVVTLCSLKLLNLEPWPTFMDINYSCRRKGTGAVYDLCRSSCFRGSRVVLVSRTCKTLARIREKLTQLLRTTAQLGHPPPLVTQSPQRGDTVLQPCYRSWRWPWSKSNRTMLRGPGRGSVSIETWRRKQAGCTAVRGRLGLSVCVAGSSESTSIFLLGL